MQTELFVEGPNGGRSRKAKPHATWSSVKFDSDMPPVTIGTPQGAIYIRIYERDGVAHAEIRRQRWGLNGSPPVGGDALIYNGAV